MSLDTLLFANQAGTVYTADDFRSLVAMIVNALGESFMDLFGSSIGFVATDTDCKVTRGGAGGLSVTVPKGWAMIAVDSGLQDFHVAHENATTVLDGAGGRPGFAAADPSLPRVDLVCIRARDNELDAGGVNAAVYFIKTGVPGGAIPSDPGVQHIVLAQATVPAGATSGTSIVVKDRRVALPSPAPRTRYTKSVAPATGVTYDTGSGNVWPTGLAIALQVPAWATKCKMRAVVNGYYVPTSLANVNLTLMCGEVQIATTNVRNDIATIVPTNTLDKTIEGEADITSIAGTTVTASLVSNNVGNALRVNSNSNAYLEVEFS